MLLAVASRLFSRPLWIALPVHTFVLSAIIPGCSLPRLAALFAPGIQSAADCPIPVKTRLLALPHCIYCIFSLAFCVLPLATLLPKLQSPIVGWRVPLCCVNVLLCHPHVIG